MDRHFLSSEVPIDYTLPLIVIISLSSIIFRRIVVSFYNIDEPRGIENSVLDADSTLAILHNLGLEFLTHTGSFYTLIVFFLINLDNLALFIFIVALTNCGLFIFINIAIKFF